MLDLAATNKISLRAQTKTHKTVEGGVLQVSSVSHQIICADWWHEKEDRHLDPGGVRDVRGRRVRGHPLWVSLHCCASGTRLEAQREAGGVPSHGMMGGDLGRAVKCYFDKDADLKDTSRWQTWRLHRIWPAVLLQRAKPGRCSSR